MSLAVLASCSRFSAATMWVAKYVGDTVRLQSALRNQIVMRFVARCARACRQLRICASWMGGRSSRRRCSRRQRHATDVTSVNVDALGWQCASIIQRSKSLSFENLADDCPVNCNVERRVITGGNICGHPWKGGIQASHKADPEIVKRNNRGGD
jgi:hypothetical protein